MASTFEKTEEFFLETSGTGGKDRLSEVRPSCLGPSNADRMLVKRQGGGIFLCHFGSKG